MSRIEAITTMSSLRFVAAALIPLASWGCSDEESARTPVAISRDSILARLEALAQEDQQDREGLTAERMMDTAVARQLWAADSARTSELVELMGLPTWPTLGELDSAAAASFFLLIQHSPSHDLAVDALGDMELLAEAGIIDRSDYALLFDRVRTEGGNPQRFGTQFSLVGGTLVPDRIESLEDLDSLRARFGLPPMQVSVDLLAEAYQVEVQWPPADTIPGPGA